ncbi:MAG TPA: glucosamine-6-phosphate deaminase [Bacteroidales bacterium]|jgi:glucosamine-6-phosphate deaminase|nr:glucosamine-6-phosphate deaminase [Bacteroidales bacterium]HOR10137.1 glucosamine-6-phosphate deaminase [Bacteroidales bacterium]
MSNKVVKSLKIDSLEVFVYPDRLEMGKASGKLIADRIKALLRQKERIRMVFAAAPSQEETLKFLRNDKEIDWSGITVFNMDEYIGLRNDHPASFGYFLSDRLFNHVHPGEVNLIDGINDPAKECERFSGLLTEKTIDIVLLGLGANGHVAFNEPLTADFNDPAVVKTIVLDEISRQQQVDENCFNDLDQVPKKAITITIPTIMSASCLYCMTPGANKQNAVKMVLEGSITNAVPGSILRRHPNCILFLDRESYGKVRQ